MAKRFTDEECVKAFWKKVDKRGPDECWNWLGAINRKGGGYGQFGVRGFIAKAHRVSWELLYGDIPKGLMVLHKCNNPSCVNPSHLYLGSRFDIRRSRVSVIKRFEKKFTKLDSESCWEWEGARSNGGYGMIGIEGKSFAAHRVSWLLYVGAIPEGLFVLHKCDNKPCVNPSHLYVGSRCDNARDAVERTKFPIRRTSKYDAVQIRKLLDTGLEPWIIAKIFGCSESTISRAGGGHSRYRRTVNLNR